MNWEKAYINTETKIIYNKYLNIKTYKKSCKNCNSHNYKKATREMQIIGNCIQRIVICFCNETFIEDMI